MECHKLYEIETVDSHQGALHRQNPTATNPPKQIQTRVKINLVTAN